MRPRLFLPALCLVAATAAAQTASIEILAPTGPTASPTELAPTGDVVVITAEDIARSGAATLAEALALLTNALAAGYGGPNALATASIGGSSAAQVLVIVDSIPVNSPLDGQFDLSKIPLSEVESIELLSGGGGALYGANAVAGVIRVNLKKRAGLAVSLGSLSYLPLPWRSAADPGPADSAPDWLALAASQRLGLSWGAVGADFAWGFSVDASGTRGAFAWSEADGTPRARELGDGAAVFASTWLEAVLGGGRLSVSAKGSWRSSGVPGSIAWPTPGATQEDGSASLSARWATDAFLSDFVALAASLDASWNGIGYDEPSTSTSSEHAVSAATATLRSSVIVAPWLALGLGFEGSIATAASTELRAPDGSAPSRLSAAAYLAPTAFLGSTTLAAAARIDVFSDFGLGVSALLGASWEGGNGFGLSLDLSTSFRAPTLQDLYWPDTGWTKGNPDLGSERAWGATMTIAWAASADDVRFRARVAPFARYVEDGIAWADDGSGAWTPSNVAAGLFGGCHASVAAGLGPWSLDLSWSWLLSADLSDGRTIADGQRAPYSPEHSLSASLSWNSGGLFLGIRGQWVSERWTSVPNAVSLDPYLVLSLVADLSLGDGWSLSAIVSNLLGTTWFPRAGYPAPGTALSLEIAFRP